MIGGRWTRSASRAQRNQAEFFFGVSRLVRLFKPFYASRERDLADEVRAIPEEAPSSLGGIEIARKQQRQQAGTAAGYVPKPGFDECLCELAPLAEWRIRDDPVQEIVTATSVPARPGNRESHPVLREPHSAISVE